MTSSITPRHLPSTPFRRFVLSSFSFVLLLVVGFQPAAALDVWDYWLMPHGLVATFDNETWSGSRVTGEHAFWRGTMNGRTVALQGGSTFNRYDIFVENGSVLEYWGTFRGNDVGEPRSHTFDQAFRWMNSSMVVGQAVEDTVTVREVDPELRRQTNAGSVTLRLEVNAHYTSYTLPETGVTYSDVLKVTFYSDKSNPNSKEVYHLARGKGTIRFVSSNSAEPSGIKKAWAVSFTNKSVGTPRIAWYDPFYVSGGVKTAALNGLFEDRTSGVNGAPVNSALPSWDSLSADGVITTDAPTLSSAGAWQVALRGSTGGGDGMADAISSTWIPVVGGKTYRLSGWTWRTDADDNVYLDFNDGQASGTNFTDVQDLASTLHQWEKLSATVTLPSGTTHIKVRAVRSGSNQGNAYFDGLILERLN